MPLGSTTYYFESREQMLLAALRHAADTEVARIEQRLRELEAGRLDRAGWRRAVVDWALQEVSDAARAPADRAPPAAARGAAQPGPARRLRDLDGGQPGARRDVPAACRLERIREPTRPCWWPRSTASRSTRSCCWRGRDGGHWSRAVVGQAMDRLLGAERERHAARRARALSAGPGADPAPATPGMWRTPTAPTACWNQRSRSSSIGASPLVIMNSRPEREPNGFHSSPRPGSVGVQRQ